MYILDPFNFRGFLVVWGLLLVNPFVGVVRSLLELIEARPFLYTNKLLVKREHLPQCLERSLKRFTDIRLIIKPSH